MVKRKLIFLLFIETILYIYIFLKMFIFCVSFQLIATKQLIYSYPFNSDLYLAPFSDLVLVTKPLYDTTPWCVTHPTLPRSGFQEAAHLCFRREHNVNGASWGCAGSQPCLFVTSLSFSWLILSNDCQFYWQLVLLLVFLWLSLISIMLISDNLYLLPSALGFILFYILTLNYLK